MIALHPDTRQSLLSSAAAAAAAATATATATATAAGVAPVRTTGDAPQLSSALRNRLLDQHTARCLAARS